MMMMKHGKEEDLLGKGSFHLHSQSNTKQKQNKPKQKKKKGCMATQKKKPKNTRVTRWWIRSYKAWNVEKENNNNNNQKTSSGIIKKKKDGDSKEELNEWISNECGWCMCVCVVVCENRLAKKGDHNFFGSFFSKFIFLWLKNLAFRVCWVELD